MNCTSLETFPLPRSCLFGDCVNNTCICYSGFSSFQEIIDLENIYCSTHIYLSIVCNIIVILFGVLLLCQLCYLIIKKFRNIVPIAKTTQISASAEKPIPVTKSASCTKASCTKASCSKTFTQKDTKLRMYLNLAAFVILDIISQILQIISVDNHIVANYYRKIMIILLGVKWPIYGMVMIRLSNIFFELNWYNENMRAIKKNEPVPDEIVKINRLIKISYLVCNPLPFSIFIIGGILEFPIDKIQIISQIAVISYGFEIVLFAFVITNISKLIKFFEKHSNGKQDNKSITAIKERSKKTQKYFLPMLMFTMPYVLSWIFPIMVNLSSIMLNLCSLCGIICGFIIVNLILHQ